MSTSYATPTSEETRARLLANIEVNGDGCWIWQGQVAGSGYGQVGFRRGPGDANRYSVMAHRVSYMLHVGPIPEDLVLDHLCRVRTCVNPAHLEPVTNRENILRGEGPTAHHARMTHCGNGHALEGANLYVKPGRGDRACLTCKRIDDTERLRIRSGLPPFTSEEREALAKMPLKPLRRKPRRRRVTPAT